MKYCFSFLLLLICQPSLALDPVYIGLGQYDNFKYFSTSQANWFNQQVDMFGIDRYGYGKAGMEINLEYGGINLSSRNGAIASSLNDFVFDLDVFSGNVILNSDSAIDDYYLYLPALGLGYQYKNDSLKVLVHLKQGLAGTNNYRSTLVPDIYSMNGYSVHLDYKDYHFSLDQSFFKETTNTQINSRIKILNQYFGIGMNCWNQDNYFLSYYLKF